MQVKVCVFGHFGDGENLLNGQTVKTKIITEELQRKFGQEQVLRIDTRGGWKSLLKAPRQTVLALRNSQNVLLFPAQNGLRVYAPLLSFFRRFFKDRKLHYIVIGGWLPQFLSKRKRLAKVLRRFDAIYVETNTMKGALEAQGFHNVLVMPNCKKLTVLAEEDLVYPDSSPLRLCTFSRVMREKGIEDAVNAVMAVNKELGYPAFSLDIYGQVDANQIEWFQNLQKTFPDYISYGGLIPFDKSVVTLKNYFALLFPTYYEGEGFAGTLIDAYSAGIPVVASDWKYNPELVNENVGVIYPTGNEAALIEALKSIAADPETMLKRKKLCLKESEKYKIEETVKVLFRQIESDKI